MGEPSKYFARRLMTSSIVHRINLDLPFTSRIIVISFFDEEETFRSKPPPGLPPNAVEAVPFLLKGRDGMNT